MAGVNLNFTCPYCGRVTTITDPNFFAHWEKIRIETSTLGDVGVLMRAITCPNPDCKNLWFHVYIHNTKYNSFNNKWEIKEKLFEWQLLPESEAKVLPDYIPTAIKQDYYEACRIRDLSPKASATLARRCLQGMIRDFWGIKKKNLYEEIKALEGKIGPLEWEAIDAVRSVGNIGAHMEKDINLIIDVEPNEAQLLIGLIEHLIDEWYVNRHEKEKKLKQLKELSQNKKKAKGKLSDKKTEQ